MSYANLISFGGVFILLLFAALFSRDRQNIPYRTVFFGLLLLFTFAGFVFLLPAGTKLFSWANALFLAILNAGMDGAHFLFGPLAQGPGQEKSIGFILAFQAFPTIVFFSALMEVLYHYGILPRIIRGLARLFRRTLAITGMESLCAASNLFVGIESLTAIRPYLQKATPSEITTILTLGMATIASSMLGFYVLVLQDTFPNIAGHLISASLMSVFAALIMAKILLPEKNPKQARAQEADLHLESSTYVFEAIIRGAQAGGKLVLGISLLLIAVLGLVALLNLGLEQLSAWISGLYGHPHQLQIQDILSVLFYPLVLVTGVPLEDAWKVAHLMGERLILTEVTAYQNLGTLITEGAFQDPRSSVLAAYALCGFTHVASMAIFAGGLAALAPNQTKTIAGVAWRALLAATLACLLTAAVAGIFYSDRFLLLGS